MTSCQEKGTGRAGLRHESVVIVNLLSVWYMMKCTDLTAGALLLIVQINLMLGGIFAFIPLFSIGLATTTDIGPTEWMAVKNRSHTILNLLSGSKKVSCQSFPEGR